MLRLNKEIYTHNNRSYEVYTVPETGMMGAMARVFVREIIRPNWRFFRTRPVDDRIFWVSEFPSIKAGEMACFKKIMEEQEKQEAIYRKWAEFDKN